MDKTLRNAIYSTVVQCRRLLEEDLARQLEGTYGIHADGAFEPLEGLAHLDAVGRADRGAIEAAICHEEAVGAGQREAVERYVRESAFTFLNRLAALKLMEHPSRALGSEEDVEEALQRLRDHVVKMIASGVRVILE
ncbi:MAG: hypothetical protein SWK90_07815 [Chloroflexota bacterium]|nr:hypothetical protein [Chloroflexota bacterium]